MTPAEILARVDEIDTNVKVHGLVRAVISEDVEWLCAQLREALQEKEPDYCYDTENWDRTLDWSDRDDLADGIELDDVVEVRTLYEGPFRYVARIPLPPTTDGRDGDEVVQWFNSEADARTAIDAARTTQGGTHD